MDKLGRSTVVFDRKVFVKGGGAVVGKKEAEGPLKDSFDKVCDYSSENLSYEDEEVRMQREALNHAATNSHMTPDKLDVILGGDLINQIIITNFMAREYGLPFLGLYNACATMAEGLLIASMMVGAGYMDHAAVIASSHNSTSERQYRFPTELGVQRPQTAQWTVTGADAMILSNAGNGITITSATIGKVVDYEIKDPNAMGAAMAPAAYDTMISHFEATSTGPQDYDLILTGDLASHGHRILLELCKRKGVATGPQFQDSGMWMYDNKQDVHAGASGAGCTAAVWSSHLLKELERNKYKKVLLLGTGALLSPISTGQGHSIPAIAHGVVIENLG